MEVNIRTQKWGLGKGHICLVREFFPSCHRGANNYAKCCYFQVFLKPDNVSVYIFGSSVYIKKIRNKQTNNLFGRKGKKIPFSHLIFSKSKYSGRRFPIFKIG